MDAYFAPVVMQLKYYSLPVSDCSRVYMDQICNVPAVQDWIASAIKEAEFFEFEEPFRLAPKSQNRHLGDIFALRCGASKIQKNFSDEFRVICALLFYSLDFGLCCTLGEKLKI